MAEKSSAEKKRRWPIIFGLFGGVLVLLIALLPTLMSTTAARQLVLNRAAPHIPGEMKIDNWSLSWLNSQAVEGLSYHDPEAGIRVDAASLTIDKGLSSLLFDRNNLGTVTLEKPAVQVRLPEPPPENGVSPAPQASVPAAPTTEETGASGRPATEPAGFGLPPMSGRIVVKQGSVDILRNGSEPENVAKNIDLDVNVSSPTEPIVYTIAALSPDSAGSVSGAGQIQLGLSDAALESVQPAGKLTITTWPISRLLDLAALYGPVPTGAGILDSVIDFDGELSQGVKLSGSVGLSKVNLSGGPLTGDTLAVDRATVDFTATGRADTLELSSLTLTSPLASGQLSATVGKNSAMQFDSDLTIDLPEVAAQLPRTLNLQEGLRITGGILTLQAKASLDQEGKQFSANASVKELAGVHGGKNISLDEPFSFNLVGRQGSGGLRLDNLVVDSSFLNGTGQGDLNDLQLDIKADLGAALAEISKFVSLQDYRATGQIDLNITAQRQNEQTVSLTARLGSDTFGFRQGKTTIIPPSPLQLTADSTLALSPDFIFSGAPAASLEYQAWLGKGTVQGREIAVSQGNRLQSIGDLIIDSQIQLGELGVLLKSLGMLPGDMALEGSTRLQMKLSGADERFTVENFSLDSPQLSLTRGASQLIPSSPLKLNGSTDLSLAADGSIASFDKPELSYETWLGSGGVSAASFNPGAKQAQVLSYQGKTDLEQLSTLLLTLELLPQDLSFSGTETSSITMDYSLERIDLASLHTEIDEFVLSQAAKTYRDNRLVIDTAGSIDMSKRQASFKPVQIQSSNGELFFEKLSVGDWNNLLDTLDSSGQARFELADILSSAADWVSLPEDLSADATIELNWSADAHSSEEHRYQLKADLNGANLVKNNLQVFSNEQVQLSLNTTRKPSTGSLILDRFSLASSPLNFETEGSWMGSAAGDTELAFNGTLAMDLERLAKLIRAITELDIEMAGKSQRPFQLSAAFTPEQRSQWYQHTTFETTFEAEFIKMMGVEIRSLEIPVKLAEGIGQAEIRGSANEGALLLQPRLDLLTTPPLLSLPENSRVLEKMQITGEMANQLLARLHPLFMGAGEMSGTFDLNIDDFNWPLGKENVNDIAFGGYMEFFDVKINSSALIGALLTALKVEDKGVDLDERKIEFVCRDGRVTTNPLKTNLGDSELTISGSLGLDTSIDYLAKVPVTQQLVGGDLYDILEGTIIQVPIGGTLAKPDISARTIERAITDLARQAGQKKLEEAASDLLKRLF